MIVALCFCITLLCDTLRMHVYVYGQSSSAIICQCLNLSRAYVTFPLTNADSFLSGLPVSRTHSFLQLLVFVRHIPSQGPGLSHCERPTLCYFCFYLRRQPHLWQFYSLCLLYSFYSLLLLLVMALEEICWCPMLRFDTSSITRTCTHTHSHTKIRYCLKLSCLSNLAHKGRWEVYDHCRTLKANKSSLSLHQMGLCLHSVQGLPS